MDWDAAYDNVSAIANADEIIAEWHKMAKAARAELPGQLGIPYGPSERECFDLFTPAGTTKGLVVFVHGGYWRRFNRDVFSWVARGPMADGWAVAIPGYTLCTAIRIGGISRQIAASVERVAEEVAGPIRLAGHSAGGHLVTRMLCPGLLRPETARRVERTVSISGLHDLDPLRLTALNETLGLTEDEAQKESPINHIPAITTPLTCWVGADELPEFRRQNQLLTHWRATGMKITQVEAEGHNHLSVIGPLADPNSDLTHALLAKI
ncbi:MAG: alpha/beta hydrolase [Pseudomonadota bacterium]